MMTKLNKVFGIISYFPNNDTKHHIEIRRKRSRRCSELLCKLNELWPDIDIMIIAQNWQDYDVPKIKNRVIKYDYDKLGILGARRELRKKFLESDYDYLIMLEDDGIISCEDPSIYMSEIDNHPNGIGVIRHTECPLMLLAISKYIYNQIDMPDIDVEKGEGFEDDIFVARCFAQFPNNCFDFPKDCIKETSFRYTGEGACPSSWSREENLDWAYMHSVTDALIESASRTHTTSNTNSTIDVVIPFVNSSDAKWSLDYTKATGQYNMSGVRFRCWNTLKYLCRSIAVNMPFVSRIILIAARESQVPDWVNSENIKIVYHRDFIPSQFLPTFNSCTIESFLYRIQDLSEKFIYFNDDIFAINPLYESDFFTDETPHIKFVYQDSYPKESIHRCQCRSGLDMITNALHRDKYPINKLFTPEHTATPMLKSTLLEVGKLCEQQINQSISILRMPKNVNQHIYSYYQYYTDNYIDDLYTYVYMELQDDLTSVQNALSSSELQLICLNDSDKVKHFKDTRANLLKIFENKFPQKCRYEI